MAGGSPWWRKLGLAVILCVAAGASRGEAVRLAIAGYDPVAYFTDAEPVAGKSDIEMVWHNARWRFASTQHRDMFAGDPEHYAPQYDGYCAMGAARGAEAHKDVVDPLAWAIVGGKLYLTHSPKALAKWRQDPAANISRADRDWPRVQKQTTVYDGYPNPAKAGR
jgi:hypothetical protein